MVPHSRSPRIPKILLLSVVALAGLSLLQSEVAAQVVDQTQPKFKSTDDLSSSGRSGQSFTAGIDAFLYGIRVVIEGKGFSSSAFFGSDVVLSLRSVENGTPTDNILATGTFSRNELRRNVPQWVTIVFKSPYRQSAGEELAFTLRGLSGGAEGFNEYGNTTNAYSSGQMFFDFTPGQPLPASSRDFAFQTLVVVMPEPAGIVLLLFGAILLVTWRRHCRGSEDSIR